MKRRSMILLGLFVALAIVLSGFGTVFAGETYKLGLSLAIILLSMVGAYLTYARRDLYI